MGRSNCVLLLVRFSNPCAGIVKCVDRSKRAQQGLSSWPAQVLDLDHECWSPVKYLLSAVIRVTGRHFVLMQYANVDDKEDCDERLHGSDCLSDRMQTHSLFAKNASNDNTIKILIWGHLIGLLSVKLFLFHYLSFIYLLWTEVASARLFKNPSSDIDLDTGTGASGSRRETCPLSLMSLIVSNPTNVATICTIIDSRLDNSKSGAG